MFQEFKKATPYWCAWKLRLNPSSERCDTYVPFDLHRLSCDKNPTDYFGYDLIEEVNRRLEVHIKKQNMNQYTDPPLSFPVMALLACNNKDVSIFDKYKLKLIFQMSIKSYVNEVSLNKTKNV